MVEGFLQIFTPDPNHPPNPMILVWMALVAIGIIILTAVIRTAGEITHRNVSTAGIGPYTVTLTAVLIGLGAILVGVWRIWLIWES